MIWALFPGRRAFPNRVMPPTDSPAGRNIRIFGMGFRFWNGKGIPEDAG
jgi:hypothetical protein